MSASHDFHGYTFIWYLNQCSGSGQFFSGSRSGSADPVFKIRIRVTSKRPHPTGSGSRSRSYLEMFLMFSKIIKNLWHFYTKSKHLMRLQIKDKKIIWTKLYFRQFYVTRNKNSRGLFVGFFRIRIWIRIRVTQKDRIRNTVK